MKINRSNALKEILMVWAKNRERLMINHMVYVFAKDHYKLTLNSDNSKSVTYPDLIHTLRRRSAEECRRTKIQYKQSAIYYAKLTERINGLLKMSKELQYLMGKIDALYGNMVVEGLDPGYLKLRNKLDNEMEILLREVRQDPLHNEAYPKKDVDSDYPKHLTIPDDSVYREYADFAKGIGDAKPIESQVKLSLLRESIFLFSSSTVKAGTGTQCDNCGSNCTKGCKGGKCGNGCSSRCSGSCAGTSGGCGSCNGGCKTENCTGGCDNDCKNTCGKGCKSGCKDGCKGGKTKKK